MLSLLLFLCSTLALATAPSAAAHDQLISSNPMPNERLPIAPEQLIFTFSGSLLDLGSEVRVEDARGKNWSLGKPAVSGEILTQPLPADMPDGEYQIRWRVVSSDGHPISATQVFLVGDTTAAEKPVAADPTLKAQSSPSTQGSASAQGSPTGQGSPGGHITAMTETTSESLNGLSLGNVVVIVIGAVVALGIYLAAVFIGRAKKNAKPTR